MPPAPAAEPTAYIGLGANLGDAPAALRAAAAAMAAHAQITVIARSSIYRSAPVDTDGPDFFNAVLAVHTSLPPEGLLAALQAIEQAHGRERPYRYAPRTLDLDVLLFGNVVQADAYLTLPHPRMHQRAFVLLPLLELVPDLVSPTQGPLRDALPALADQALSRWAPFEP